MEFLRLAPFSLSTRKYALPAFPPVAEVYLTETYCETLVCLLHVNAEVRRGDLLHEAYPYEAYNGPALLSTRLFAPAEAVDSALLVVTGVGA